MKFLLAWLVTLCMACILGAGILRAVEGDWWLLLASAIAYLLAFARFGCSSASSH